VGFDVVGNLLGLPVGAEVVAEVGAEVVTEVRAVLGMALEVDVSLADGLDVALSPLPPAGPFIALDEVLFVAFAAGPLVDLAAVANAPNSMPSIDIDPSLIVGSDIIMERLWALVTTPRTEARRMTFIEVV
jgi:hypothetical protein